MNAIAAMMAAKAKATPTMEGGESAPPPPPTGEDPTAEMPMQDEQQQQQQAKVAKSRWAAVGGAVRTGVQTTLWAKSKRRAEDEEFLASLMGDGLASSDMSREQFEREFASRMQAWVDRKAQQEAAMRDRHQEQFYHLRARLKGLEMEASITSAPVTALRRKQQSLLAGKHYAEAFDHMKVRSAAVCVCVGASAEFSYMYASARALACGLRRGALGRGGWGTSV